MTLEETAEFVRLYAKCFTYPRPVDVRVWTDVLLTGWYRRRGPAGIPRELAILAADSHPAFLALRSSTARILPLMTLEPLIPKPERLRPSVHHEHYECFFHDLTAQVRSLYNQVFSRPIENPSVFTSYLFGYDHQLLTYSMGQSGKYGEDPRMIFERRKQGMIPPWKPFSPEQAETTAARISACMTWILGTAPPTIEEAESLARMLRGLSFK
jgi:hypothetical protein